MYSAMRSQQDSNRKDSVRLTARLERIRKLYGWRDFSREQYLAEKAEIQKQLAATSPQDKANHRFDRLARRLFQEVWIEERKVVAVRPQPEFVPFFQLDSQTRVGSGGNTGWPRKPVRLIMRNSSG